MQPPKVTRKQKVESVDHVLMPLHDWSVYLLDKVRLGNKLTFEDSEAFRAMVFEIQNRVSIYGDYNYRRGERETIPLFGEPEVSPVKEDGPRIVYATAHGKGTGEGGDDL